MRNLTRLKEIKQKDAKKVSKMVLLDKESPYVPHGLGRLIYSGIYGAYILEGYFDNGKATGFARWIWDDGVNYTGQLKNFICHGEGKMILGNAFKDEVLEGKFEDGVINAKSKKETQMERNFKERMGKNLLESFRKKNEEIKKF